MLMQQGGRARPGSPHDNWQVIWPFPISFPGGWAPHTFSWWRAAGGWEMKLKTAIGSKGHTAVSPDAWPVQSAGSRGAGPDLVAHKVAGRVGLVQQGAPLIVDARQDGDDAQRPHVRMLHSPTFVLVVSLIYDFVALS